MRFRERPVKMSSDRARMMDKFRLGEFSEDEFRSSEDDGEDEFRLGELSEDEFSREDDGEDE